MSGRAIVAKAVRGSVGDNRLLHALLGLAYLLAYWNISTEYISVVWAYAGFLYRPMTVDQIAFAIAGVMAVAFALPTRLRGPSAICLWLLFAFVYVPTLAQTYMLGTREGSSYTLALAALTGGMIFACWFCRGPGPAEVRRPFPLEVGLAQQLAYGFLAMAMLVSVLLLYYYRDILTLADITNSGDVYALRFAASDITGGIVGYVRAYYSYVLGPGVVAFALASRRYRWFIFPGLACFLIAYMIDGSKISMIIPMAMMATYVLIRWARSSVSMMTGALGVLTLVCGTLVGSSSVFRFIADLILLRSIAIPGQQFVLYYDLFRARGYTWWSNVKGISLFVPPPANYAADPRWPSLGQIVGEDLAGFSSRNNYNASLFAGEGVAAAGPLGVVVIALVLAIYLRVLDRAAAGWPQVFVVLVTVPVGLALTNTHLSTMLVSFGGAFWVALFIVLKRAPTPARSRYR